MKDRKVHLIAAKDEFVALLCFCLAGTGLVAYLLWVQLVANWAAVAFPLLAGGLFVSIRELMQAQLEYTLDEQGIHFGPSLGRDSIPWSAVTAIDVKVDPDRPPYVALQLKVGGPHTRALSLLHKWLAQLAAGEREPIPTVHLYTAGLTMSHEQILQMIQRYWQRQKEAV